MSGAASSRHNKPWTVQEKQYVRNNYRRQTVDEIAAALGRSRGAIRGAAQALELTRSRARAPKPKPVCNVKPGDKVRVTLPILPGLKTLDQRVGRAQRQYTAKVLQVYDKFVLVQVQEGWRECINIGTVIAGEASIAYGRDASG